MFTDCEKRELIKSLAMGMSFDEISDIYGISEADVTTFYSDHKNEVERRNQIPEAEARWLK